MYKIFLTSKAQREYTKLPTVIAHTIKAVIFGPLRENPFSRSLDIKKLQVPLEGFRLRVGDYRVMYDIEEKWIKIYSIRHRKDAYK